MNISEVKVKLSSRDILSIINEFVRINGLEVRSVVIADGIILEGTFKKGISVEFQVKADILECKGNKIFAKISKVKVLNFGIFRIIRSFILKKVSNIFVEYGIESKKDVAIIDINKILKDIPYVDLKLEELYIRGSEIWAEASNIEISIAGQLIKNIEIEKINESEEEEIKPLQVINKVEDNYSRGRQILEEKLPEKIKDYKDYLFILPDIVSLIYRLLKDKRVPVKTKLVMSAAIAYITISSDLIPKNIPFIGVVDDIGVAFFALNKVLNDVSLDIIIENWEGRNDILLVMKNGIDYLINFTGAKNVEKLYDVVEELSIL